MDAPLDFELRFKRAIENLGLQKQAVAQLGSKPPEDDTALPEDGDVDGTDMVETAQGEEESGAALGEKLFPNPTVINLFQHPDAHPIVLDLALLRKYGPEWMEWEPETLVWRIPQDFRTVSVSEVNLNKIQALKTLHFVDTYWSNWEVFNPCTMAFNGLLPDFEVMQVPTAAQCMVSVDVANRIRQDVRWSEEVTEFLSIVHFHDGIFCPIEPLDFVTVDGENYPVDCAIVKEQWPAVRKSGRAPAEETVEAEQLRRLLLIREFLEESRERLRQQLSLAAHD